VEESFLVDVGLDFVLMCNVDHWDRGKGIPVVQGTNNQLFKVSVQPKYDLFVFSVFDKVLLCHKGSITLKEVCWVTAVY